MGKLYVLGKSSAPMVRLLRLVVRTLYDMMLEHDELNLTNRITKARQL